MEKSNKRYTVKNTTWNKNHQKILEALMILKGEITLKGRKIEDDTTMPSCKQIAEHTGLTYATIYKHLAELGDTEHYKAHLNKFWLKTEFLLMKLFSFGCMGDANSIKMFVYILSKAQDRVNKAGGCKNYIQINNLVITQENLEKLPQPELKQIEEKISGLLRECALN